MNYEPGPENINIFGEIVHGGSPIAKTLSGKYMHIILGPVSIDDEKKREVNFYLGDKDGDNVKANKSFDTLMKSKLNDALDAKKVDIASSIGK